MSCTPVIRILEKHIVADVRSLYAEEMGQVTQNVDAGANHHRASGIWHVTHQEVSSKTVSVKHG
jgi:hypothetical protein